MEVKFWEKIGILENGKTCGCGGRKEIKKKEKGKEIKKGRYFLLDLKMKRQIPGFKSRMRKTFRKIPKSSEIQVSRNNS